MARDDFHQLLRDTHQCQHVAENAGGDDDEKQHGAGARSGEEAAPDGGDAERPVDETGNREGEQRADAGGLGCGEQPPKYMPPRMNGGSVRAQNDFLSAAAISWRDARGGRL